jgi:hypothetical protein
MLASFIITRKGRGGSLRVQESLGSMSGDVLGDYLGAHLGIRK